MHHQWLIRAVTKLVMMFQVEEESSDDDSTWKNACSCLINPLKLKNRYRKAVDCM